MTAVRVAVLGSTGSIGTQTLEVIAAAASDEFEVTALSAATSTELLARQIVQFAPQAVAVATDDAATELRERLRYTPAATEVSSSSRLPEILVGPEAPATLAASADIAVNGVVGFAGLEVTLATLRAGKRLALANKESLIAAGPLCQPLRSIPGAEIIPIDSEHCALHQCLNQRGVSGLAFSPSPNLDPSPNPNPDLAKLVLTASGGPFLGKTAQQLSEVTVDEALTHPTWQMGPKITVDSSTLMNKGLEVIEAHELFGVSYGDIDVVIHPQSVVHSMVTFTDGATLAQLSLPDMRQPIGYALSYPNRFDVAFGAIDWTAVPPLEFSEPDRDTFACLDLAIAAGRAGGTAPAWLNGANEAAVAAFLDSKIAWHQIAELLSDALSAHDGAPCDSIEAVVAADAGGRRQVAESLSNQNPATQNPAT